MCKISDVGLSRLVPASVADNVTHYYMTSPAGRICYIDPEYQQIGKLGVKSDIYLFGVMLLQILTARPPMGLIHQVQRSITEGEFADLLDPTVPCWPVEEALTLAKIALQCVELKKKDRPDLCSVVLPELNRLKVFGRNNRSSQNSPKSSPRENSASARQVSELLQIDLNAFQVFEANISGSYNKLNYGLDQGNSKNLSPIGSKRKTSYLFVY